MINYKVELKNKLIDLLLENYQNGKISEREFFIIKHDIEKSINGL